LADETKLPHYHYKDVFESPSDTDVCHRSPDNCPDQPRHNIKKCFDDGTLKLDDNDAISSFSTEFNVQKKLIKDHLQHLTTFERKTPAYKGQVGETQVETTEMLRGL